ncbi:MAG: fasciclin domain-containing protein [Ferruginibacter sp.]
MLTNHINKKTSYLLILATMFFLASCNKELEQFPEIATPVYPTGPGIAGAIAASANDSLYNRLLIKSGLSATLNNNSNSYTMFIPDNNGMKLFINAISGGLVPLNAPDAVFSGFITANIPAATAAGIVSYNTVGQKFPSSSFPGTFPNFPLPTLIVLDPSQPFVRMPIFPAKGAISYVNNIPVTGFDQAASNGIIHHVATIVAPPTTVLAGLIYPDPNLSYFVAGVARADSGQSGLNKFDSLLKYGVTNMTVLVPNNAAFQTLIYGTAYGYALSLGAPPSVANAQANGAVALGPAIFSNPAFYGLLPASSVRGILAYHFLASNATGSYKPDIRVFSNNFSSTPSFVKTLVNGSVAVHPGIMAQATFTGATVTSLKFTGLGTFPPGGAPFSGAAATAVSTDKHAVNGVAHVIDKVLLPQ